MASPVPRETSKHHATIPTSVDVIESLADDFAHAKGAAVMIDLGAEPIRRNLAETVERVAADQRKRRATPT